MGIKGYIRAVLNQVRLLDNLRDRWYIARQRRKLKKKIQYADAPIKVVLGAGQTRFEGWMATDLPFFDITNPKDWQFYFGDRKPDNLLTEHVLEHLTEQQVEVVLQLAYQYLSKGGCFRIAVPDKNHPNSAYIEYVKPGGSGPGANDHKSFWDYKHLSELCKQCNYVPELREYYDQEGTFHKKELGITKGVIQRTRRNAPLYGIEDYSSLIIDAVKP